MIKLTCEKPQTRKCRYLKCVAISGSAHIHNAQTKGTQHKSMLPALLRTKSGCSVLTPL